MAVSRSTKVNLEMTPYYHCVSRCVRRAFLCGEDALTGKSFEHRRGWIESRLRLLSQVFSVDVFAYAVMSNHFHLVVHVDAARAEAWDDDEVVARYGRLFPMAKTKYENAPKVLQKELLPVWRERLGSLSWMMRSLNEWVARKANKEDDCTGRFWEGRFSSQPLLDEAAVLTCMAYVDLNPVRAGMAKTLEQSEHTSIYARLKSAAAALDERAADTEARKRRVTGAAAREASENSRSERKKFVPTGLAPFADQAPQRDDTAERDVLRARPIPMKFVNYVELVEWTGRTLRTRGSSGVLEGEATLLKTLRIDPSAWVQTMGSRGLSTQHVLGSEARVREFAEARGLKRAHGVGHARAMAA